MNKFILITGLTLFSLAVKAQTKALTENGREVILFDNGTWKYSEEGGIKSAAGDSIPVNTTKFTRPGSATFLVKSNVLNVGVYINPGKWTFSPHKDNETNPEYRFTMKSQEGYAIMVSEKTEINLEMMRQIALLNAQKAAWDAKETFAEYRTVNGKKILCLKFEGTIKGIKFIYFGYYFSNANGTVQLISFTSQQFFDGVQKDLESLLNGLVEVTK
jgi:hypothetical protein